ncbi:unnamed protein product, partial [Ectocarpus sp. 12 AP-2014]
RGRSGRLDQGRGGPQPVSGWKGVVGRAVSEVSPEKKDWSFRRWRRRRGRDRGRRRRVRHASWQRRERRGQPRGQRGRGTGRGASGQPLFPTRVPGGLSLAGRVQ